MIFQALRGVAGGPPGEYQGDDFQTDNLKKSSKKEKALSLYVSGIWVYSVIERIVVRRRWVLWFCGCLGCVLILDVEYKITSKYGKTLDKQSILS